jgi:hypothetical protein
MMLPGAKPVISFCSMIPEGRSRVAVVPGLKAIGPAPAAVAAVRTRSAPSSVIPPVKLFDPLSVRAELPSTVTPPGPEMGAEKLELAGVSNTSSPLSVTAPVSCETSVAKTKVL